MTQSRRTTQRSMMDITDENKQSHRLISEKKMRASSVKSRRTVKSSENFYSCCCCCKQQKIISKQLEGDHQIARLSQTEEDLLAGVAKMSETSNKVNAGNHNHQDHSSCQVINCYYSFSLLIYIILQLLLIGATSSQATSQIRSIWVSKPDDVQSAAEADASHASASVNLSTLSNQTTNSTNVLKKQQQDERRRLDFEETRSNLSAAPIVTLHTSASSLQPVAIEPEEQASISDGGGSSDLSAKKNFEHTRSSSKHERQPQQQVAQRRSFQSYAESPHTQQPQFKVARLSDETASSGSSHHFDQDERFGGSTSARANLANNASASVSNAQVHFDEDEQQRARNHQQQQQQQQQVAVENEASDRPALNSLDDRRPQDSLFRTSAPTADLTPFRAANFSANFDDLSNRTNYSQAVHRQQHAADKFADSAAYFPLLAGELTDNVNSVQADLGEQNFFASSMPLNNSGNSFTYSKSAPQAAALDAPAAIYYLPDGDKWNQQQPGENLDTTRSHLQKPLEPQYSRATTNPTSGQSLMTGNYSPQSSFWLSDREQPRHSFSPPSNAMVMNHLDDANNHLLYQLTAQSQNNEATTTTPLPHVFIAPTTLHHFAAAPSTSHDMKAQSHFNNQYVTTAPPVAAYYQARRKTTVLPQTLHRFISANNYLLAPLEPTRVRHPNAHYSNSNNKRLYSAGNKATGQTMRSRSRQVINLGEAPQHSSSSMSSELGSSGGAARSLLRSYSPMSLLGGGGGGGSGGGKAKKSLLSTLNDKFSSWTAGGGSGDSSLSEVKHLIEESFYDQQQQDQVPQRVQQKRRRPQAPLRPSAFTHHQLAFNNNYNFPAIPPLSMMYGPQSIRQPTVAPATSALSNFYGGTTGSLSPPGQTLNYHKQASNSGSSRYNTKTLQQQQQHFGGAGQAASFIPVVAVQVTRTSPAPNAAHVELAPLQTSGSSDGSDTSHSTTDNKIEEYLAMKTGQLPASEKRHHSSSNLHDKQKWDDSYGSAAAATASSGAGHGAYHQHSNNNFYYAPASSSQAATTTNALRARRRHAALAQPPQHETTIKSAVFGYLPHQADAPLMQAMNMLQQLPASQVQHHHHRAQPAYHLLPSSHGSGAQQVSGGASPGGEPASADQIYANQMDKSQQSVDAATPPLDYQSLVAVAAAAAAAAASTSANQQQHQHQQQQQDFHSTAPQLNSPAAAASDVDDQPMSLALQLQANNYVQNDIAHPFWPPSPLTNSYGQNYNQARAASGAHHSKRRAPLDFVYSTGGQAAGSSNNQQLHYPAFQFMSPNQFSNAAYQEQLSQLINSNPLLMGHDGTAQSSSQQSQQSQHPFQGYAQLQHDRPLATSPDDYNPLLSVPPSPFFAQFAQQQQQQNLQGSAVDQQLAAALQQYQLAAASDSADKSEAAAQTAESQKAVESTTTSSAGDGDANQQSSTSNGDQQQDSTSSDSGDGSQRAQQLTSKGKKRSSDFFASAGQLLLSALPLLMFPTLGRLMFASPSISAARFQSAPGAQLSQASGLGGGTNSLLDDGLVLNASPGPQVFTPSPLAASNYGGGGASNYAPESGSTFALESEKFNESQPTTTTSVTGDGDNYSYYATEQPLASKTSGQYYKSSNSLPALTGFRLDGERTRNRSTSTGGTHSKSATHQSTHRPIAIILTSSSAPSRVSSSQQHEHSTTADLSSSASGSGELLERRNYTAPTIFTVLESTESATEQDETTTMAPRMAPLNSKLNASLHGESANSTTSENRRTMQNETTLDPFQQVQNNHTLPFQSDHRKSSARPTSPPATSTTPRTTQAPIVYDIGYEGADFDAQYATLRRNDSSSLYQLTTLAPPLIFELKSNNHRASSASLSSINKLIKDKSHYQYDELLTPEQSERRQTPSWTPSGTSAPRTKANATHQQYETSSEQLYPVSSWPSSLRRKTVSLITSTGNKTLLDSSDRYHAIMMSGGGSGQPATRDRVSNSSKRHQAATPSSSSSSGSDFGTGSRNQYDSANMADESQPPSIVYADERPLIVHRQHTSAQLEIGTGPSIQTLPSERRNSLPLGPADGESSTQAKSSTTTRQQLNKKRLSTLDDSSLVNSRHQAQQPVADFGSNDSSGRTRLAHSQLKRRRRRRKRDLISAQPLNELLLAPIEPKSSLLPAVAGEQPTASKTTAAAAIGQVVKLRSKKRRVKKRKIKRIERRQDAVPNLEVLNATVFSPQQTTNDTTRHLGSSYFLLAANQTAGGGGSTDGLLAHESSPSLIGGPSSQETARAAAYDERKKQSRTRAEADGPHEETLKRDASKSKSAIVTAMITHVANDDNESSGGGNSDQDGDGQSDSDGGGGGDPRDELREQLLAKKLLLDRLATRAGATGASSSDQDDGQHLDSPRVQVEFNSGGRGRFRPEPVLDYTVPSVYAGRGRLDHERQSQNNFSATRFINNRARNSRAKNRSQHRNNSLLLEELNDDTKRALANFGTLLLEDTLEQEVNGSGSGAPLNSTRRSRYNNSGGSQPGASRKRSLSRPRYSASGTSGPFMPLAGPQASSAYETSDVPYDSAGSATERYSTQATRAPLALDGGSGDGAHQDGGWLRQGGAIPGERIDNNLANQTIGNYDGTQTGDDNGYGPMQQPSLPLSKSTRSANNTLAYQYPPPRGRSQHSYRNSSDLEAHYEHFDSARTRSKQTSDESDNAEHPSGGNGHAYPASLHNPQQQHELGVGSQAVAFKTHQTSRVDSGEGGPLTGAKISSSDSPINKYNNFLMSHLSSGGASNRTLASGPMNSTSESKWHQYQPVNASTSAAGGGQQSDQLDARYSSYSNYSTVAPAYPHDQYDRYDRYDSAGRDHYQSQRPREQLPTPNSPPPPAHHYYNYPPHDVYNYNNSNNSSYQPTGAHRQHHQAPVASYHQQQQHHHSRQTALEDYPPHDHYDHAHHATDSGPLRGPPPPARSSSQSLHNGEHPAGNTGSASRYYPPHPHQYSGGGPPSHALHQHYHSSSSTTYAPASSHQTYSERAPPPPNAAHHHSPHYPRAPAQEHYAPPHSPSHNNQQHYHHAQQAYDTPVVVPAAPQAARSSDSTKAVNDYLKRVQFSDSDRDKLMASYLTCDGLLNDNDHCLERLSCEFSDPQNIEKANKLDRAVSSILLGHILINTYIPNSFKLRLKSASLFGYTQSGKCSKFACSKLAVNKQQGSAPVNQPDSQPLSGEESKPLKSTEEYHIRDQLL